MLFEVTKQNKIIILLLVCLLFFPADLHSNQKSHINHVQVSKCYSRHFVSAPEKASFETLNYAIQKLSIQYECKYCFSSYKGDFFFN